MLFFPLSIFPAFDDETDGEAREKANFEYHSLQPTAIWILGR
jgi:hypothetical protein